MSEFQYKYPSILEGCILRHSSIDPSGVLLHQLQTLPMNRLLQSNEIMNLDDLKAISAVASKINVLA